ncbi:hypothetical protein [Myxosarcina sp. GI1(2024)]
MQIEEFLNLLRLPLIYLITVAVVILSIAIGFRLGSYARRHQKSEKKLSLATLIGAMLGLLALMFSAVEIIIIGLIGLDRPRLGSFLKVSQTTMMELQQKLNSSVR